MNAVIKIFSIFIKIIYFFLKLLPTKNRVSFFSRQSDRLSLDFWMLMDELECSDDTIDIKYVCHRFRNLHDGIVRFVINLLKSMYYLATSKVCVLDAYWPTVSMLNHKKDLKVIQIWHSIGKIKKTGYQTLGKEQGRSIEIACSMSMHKNYDYIISGGIAWNKYYCEAFNVEENVLRNYGLPRLDYIYNRRNIDHEPLWREKHPEFEGKILVLYAPTHRKYRIEGVEELQKLFSNEKYAFICKFHPNQKLDENVEHDFAKFAKDDTFDILQSCDYLITDYSSLALEAAAIDKKTLYYLFDYDRYIGENGTNIDLFEIMPKVTFFTPEEIYEAIDGGKYPIEELDDYKHKYLPEDLGNSTEKIVNLIIECLQVDDKKVAEFPTEIKDIEIDKKYA